MSIKVQQLSKIYGKQKAVDSISFEVKKGDILGFLGPNGAGKSTTMKIATGYIPPSEGTILIDELDVTKSAIQSRKLIGYLPEHNPLYLDMYVKEYLSFIGEVQGMKRKDIKIRVEELIDMCGLVKEQSKLIGKLSKGYRQRVGLAQALMHDPSVLILDEPTTGLDPNQLVEIRKLIKKVSKDKTVMLSTHIMQEVKALCNRVVIINEGKIVADDQVIELTQGTSILELETEGQITTEELAEFGKISSEGNVYNIHLKTNEDVRPKIFELAKKNNWVILSMQQKEKDLEQIFSELTKKVNVGDL